MRMERQRGKKNVQIIIHSLAYIAKVSFVIFFLLLFMENDKPKLSHLESDVFLNSRKRSEKSYLRESSNL